MTVKRFSTLMLTLTAALLTGCRSQETFTTQSTMVPPGSFIRSWTASPDFDEITGISQIGDLLFVRGEGNLVAGYDLQGGLKFRSHIGNGYDVVGEPMLQAERLVFPVSSGIEIYNREGTPLKRIPFDQPIRSQGVLFGQTVFVGTDSLQGGRVAAIALDEEYYVRRWSRLMNGVVHTRPALFENILYVATESGSVVAMTTDPVLFWPRTPELKDQVFHTQGKILAAIRVDESGVYVPSTDTKLYCLDHVSGKIKWEYISGAPLKHSPQVSGDMVYIPVDGKGLVALEKKQNNRFAAPKWISADAAKVLADDAKMVYVLTTGGTINAIDKATGEVRYSTGSVKFADGVEHFDPKSNTIYAVTERGTIVAIQPVNTAGVVGQLVMLDEVTSGATVR